MKTQKQMMLDWNRQYPPGTPVTRYRFINPLSDPMKTKTTSTAWLLGADIAQRIEGHTCVVMVAGVSGCVSIQSVAPIT